MSQLSTGACVLERAFGVAALSLCSGFAAVLSLALSHGSQGWIWIPGQIMEEPALCSPHLCSAALVTSGRLKAIPISLPVRVCQQPFIFKGVSVYSG